MPLPIENAGPAAPTNSATRRAAAGLTAAVTFVALWLAFAQMAGWLFASDVGEITKLFPWAVFNFLGGAFIHFGVRKLAEIIAGDYSRTLLTSIIIGVTVIFLAVIGLALTGTNSSTGNLMLVWTAIGIVGFLAGAMTETIWSRRA